MIPSPKSTEFNYGYKLGLTRLIAATVSVAHITAENSNISDTFRFFP